MDGGDKQDDYRCGDPARQQAGRGAGRYESAIGIKATSGAPQAQGRPASVKRNASVGKYIEHLARSGAEGDCDVDVLRWKSCWRGRRERRQIAAGDALG